MVETSYVSDIADIEQQHLMDEPFATLTLDLNVLNTEDAMMISQGLGFDKLNDEGQRVMGDLMTGASDEMWGGVEATIHLDVESAIGLLQAGDLLELPEQEAPPAEEAADGEGNETEMDPEEQLEEIAEEDE